MIDENAFGVLLGHFDLESLEYSLGEEAFLEHLSRFDAAVEERMTTEPLALGLRRIDLGHAVYFEFADGDQSADPIGWVRRMRQALIDADVPNICVLAFGGRWVQEEDADALDSSSQDSPAPGRESGAWRVSSSEPDASNPLASPVPIQEQRDEQSRSRAYGPSEPLRKVLAVEAFAQPTTSSDTDQGWGPGLYVEQDAIEQLGKSLKNAPTPLSVLSSVFYRLGA